MFGVDAGIIFVVARLMCYVPVLKAVDVEIEEI